MTRRRNQRWVEREHNWQEQQKERLEESRRQRPAASTTTGRPSGLGEGVAAIAQELDAGSRASAVPPTSSGVPQARASSELLGQLQYHRKGEAGLMGGVFQPDRHTWMVEGRPVQVELI